MAVPHPLLPPGPDSDAPTNVHALPEPETIERRSGMQRRATRRVGVCLGVGVRSGASAYTGFTSDLSEGGLFVATHELQPIGTEIELMFKLPEGDQLNVRGVVRWLRDPFDYESHAPPGMGIQFVAMPERTVFLIHEFVENREPMFFEG